jgi:hypothetical protein
MLQVAVAIAVFVGLATVLVQPAGLNDHNGSVKLVSSVSESGNHNHHLPHESPSPL